MASKLYDKLIEADRIIFGTPIYFWSINAQAKALIGQCFLFSPERRLSNKVAAVVGLQGEERVQVLLKCLVSFLISKR